MPSINVRRLAHKNGNVSIFFTVDGQRAALITCDDSLPGPPAWIWWPPGADQDSDPEPVAEYPTEADAVFTVFNSLYCDRVAK